MNSDDQADNDQAGEAGLRGFLPPGSQPSTTIEDALIEAIEHRLRKKDQVERLLQLRCFREGLEAGDLGGRAYYCGTGLLDGVIVLPPSPGMTFEELLEQMHEEFGAEVPERSADWKKRVEEHITAQALETVAEQPGVTQAITDDELKDYLEDALLEWAAASVRASQLAYYLEMQGKEFFVSGGESDEEHLGFLADLNARGLFAAQDFETGIEETAGAEDSAQQTHYWVTVRFPDRYAGEPGMLASSEADAVLQECRRIGEGFPAGFAVDREEEELAISCRVAAQSPEQAAITGIPALLQACTSVTGLYVPATFSTSILPEPASLADEVGAIVP